MTEENVKVKSEEAEQFRCQNCGDEMTYNPATETLFCETCQTTRKIDVEEYEVVENNLEDALSNSNINTIEINNDSTLNEIVCKSCGSRSIFNGTVFATKCVYCGSSYVANVEISNYIKPEYIIPFKVERNVADKKIVDWANSKFYMNTKFKKEIKNDGMYGVYISYWTFDVSSFTSYTANRGDYYYVPVTRTINGKTQTTMQRRTRWTRVRGDLNHWFDDVLVPAVNNKIPSIYEQSEFFNTKELVPYDEQYISGFLAMKYEVELKDGWDMGKRIVFEDIEGFIKQKIGGDVVAGLQMNPILSDGTYKHVILPLWLSGHTYKDEIYTFIVNGQNGTVSGKYPLDALRIIITVVLVTILFIALYYGYMYS